MKVTTTHACHIIAHHYCHKTPSASSVTSSASKSQKRSTSTTKSPVISKQKSKKSSDLGSSINNRSGTYAWEALCMYAGAREQLMRHLDGKSNSRNRIDGTSNGILLSDLVHPYFDKLKGWFEHRVLDYFLASLTF